MGILDFQMVDGNAELLVEPRGDYFEALYFAIVSDNIVSTRIDDGRYYTHLYRGNAVWDLILEGGNGVYDHYRFDDNKGLVFQKQAFRLWGTPILWLNPLKIVNQPTQLAFYYQGYNEDLSILDDRSNDLIVYDFETQEVVLHAEDLYTSYESQVSFPVFWSVDSYQSIFQFENGTLLVFDIDENSATLVSKFTINDTYQPMQFMRTNEAMFFRSSNGSMIHLNLQEQTADKLANVQVIGSVWFELLDNTISFIDLDFSPFNSTTTIEIYEYNMPTQTVSHISSSQITLDDKNEAPLFDFYADHYDGSWYIATTYRSESMTSTSAEYLGNVELRVFDDEGMDILEHNTVDQIISYERITEQVPFDLMIWPIGIILVITSACWIRRRSR